MEVLYRVLPDLVLPGEVAPGALAMLLLWTGNVTAVVAMVAGIVDMARLPEKQDVMSAVYRHMAWMTLAWGLMLGAGILRTIDQAWIQPAGWVGLAMEVTAVVCLIFGGLQASRLVYHLHMGERE